MPARPRFLALLLAWLNTPSVAYALCPCINVSPQLRLSPYLKGGDLLVCDGTCGAQLKTTNSYAFPEGFAMGTDGLNG